MPFLPLASESPPQSCPAMTEDSFAAHSLVQIQHKRLKQIAFAGSGTQGLLSLNEERLDFKCRPPHHDKRHREMRERHKSSNSDDSLLVNAYENVFPSGNRNAAAFVWSHWLLGKSHEFSAEKFQKLFSMFCGVSGAYLSPDEGAFPQQHARWRLTLDQVTGGQRKGFMFYCTGCKGWPCLCDAKDFIRVDTKTVTLKGGKKKKYHFAVMGDPCKDPKSLTKPFWEPLDKQQETVEKSAPEVSCGSDGLLQNAQKSDHGHIILTMFHDDEDDDIKAHHQADYEEKCKTREENGFESGMGMIFRKVAGISPLDDEAKAKAKLAPTPPADDYSSAHPGDQHRSESSGPELNIYGRKLVTCGSDPGSSADGGTCSYAAEADDPGRHQVCVTKLPAHFSRQGGQGDWSEPETGREWCVCIWAYANWVLNHDVDQLPVKCDGVTEKVLVSEYAMQAWSSCGKHWKACKGYAKAIETLCSHCMAQAPDDAAQQELKKKCKSMRSAAKA